MLNNNFLISYAKTLEGLHEKCSLYPQAFVKTKGGLPPRKDFLLTMLLSLWNWCLPNLSSQSSESFSYLHWVQWTRVLKSWLRVLIPCLFPGIIIYSLSDEFYLLLMSFTDRVPDQLLTSTLHKYLLVLNTVV